MLQVPIVDRDTVSGTIVYEDPDSGRRTQVPVTRGRCKLQWKADWAMRSDALGVDYEMPGKDLIASVRLAAHICESSERSRRKPSPTNSSSTKKDRKSPSREAMG